MAASDSKNDKQTLGFQAEVKQLLHLMIHSLYSNKEIFLRELISNASDAADKLRFEAINNAALFEGDPELKIRVAFDKAARTITISDNGIGMSREEVDRAPRHHRQVRHQRILLATVRRPAKGRRADRPVRRRLLFRLHRRRQGSRVDTRRAGVAGRAKACAGNRTAKATSRSKRSTSRRAAPTSRCTCAKARTSSCRRGS